MFANRTPYPIPEAGSRLVGGREKDLHNPPTQFFRNHEARRALAIGMALSCADQLWLLRKRPAASLVPHHSRLCRRRFPHRAAARSGSGELGGSRGCAR